MNPGYRALREGAAILDLSDRAKIFATGEDRARLLHAMTTNHVQQLQPGQGCYAFFLTAQGRILSDVNLVCLEDRILLDLEPEVREKIYQHLDKFIIADDVTLEDATDALGAIAVEGPRSKDILAAVSAPVPQQPFDHAAWDGNIVARVSFTGASGYRIFAPRENTAGLMDRLERAGAVRADAPDARIVRLENAKPRYGDDIFDLTLPLETQQSHGLHFTKGCYIGQEIVERVRSRGHVNRLLAGFEMDGAEPPPPGAALAKDSAEVGKTASAAFSPTRDKVVGLAYVRTQFAEPGTVLTLDGRSVVITPAGGPEPRVEC